MRLLCGAGLKGAGGRRAQAKQGPQGGSEENERPTEDRGSKRRSCFVIARNRRFPASSQNAKRSDGITRRRRRLERQRACAVLAAGASAVSTTDPAVTIYKRAAEDSVVFAADPSATVYKLAAAASKAFVAAPAIPRYEPPAGDSGQFTAIASIVYK